MSIFSSKPMAPAEMLTNLAEKSSRNIMSAIQEKNEERKLAEQETKLASKTEEELQAYAWKSTHMRATQGPFHA
ncbi:hypothetical protein PIB30_095458 [Stylosanthes scabra]|uniref:Uncharacterized protein n=1 Tax=Stylosanthes scabra TaxID=79078 RepID=A0ABU6TWC1_9FABA|nr:hypothetical protein [Stylosanthes scabra]